MSLRRINTEVDFTLLNLKISFRGSLILGLLNFIMCANSEDLVEIEVLVHHAMGIWGLSVCISNKFPDAGDAADPRSIFSMTSFLISI